MVKDLYKEMLNSKIKSVEDLKCILRQEFTKKNTDFFKRYLSMEDAANDRNWLIFFNKYIVNGYVVPNKRVASAYDNETVESIKEHLTVVYKWIISDLIGLYLHNMSTGEELGTDDLYVDLNLTPEQKLFILYAMGNKDIKGLLQGNIELTRELFECEDVENWCYTPAVRVFRLMYGVEKNDLVEFNKHDFGTILSVSRVIGKSSTRVHDIVEKGMQSFTSHFEEMLEDFKNYGILESRKNEEKVVDLYTDFMLGKFVSTKELAELIESEVTKGNFDFIRRYVTYNNMEDINWRVFLTKYALRGYVVSNLELIYYFDLSEEEIEKALERVYKAIFEDIIGIYVHYKKTNVLVKTNECYNKLELTNEEKFIVKFIVEIGKHNKYTSTNNLVWINEINKVIKENPELFKEAVREGLFEGIERKDFFEIYTGIIKIDCKYKPFAPTVEMSKYYDVSRARIMQCKNKSLRIITSRINRNYFSPLLNEVMGKRRVM